MKIPAIIVGLFISLLASAQTFNSVVSSNLISYGAINTTSSTSAPVVVSSLYLPSNLNYLFQNGGMPNTNAISVAIQLSFGTNDWTTVQTFKFSSTNAADETARFTSSMRVYSRVVITTTNNYNVGAKAIFPSN